MDNVQVAWDLIGESLYSTSRCHLLLCLCGVGVEVSAKFVCKVRPFPVLRTGSAVAIWHHKHKGVRKTAA
jgi:hypothetical protein